MISEQESNNEVHHILVHVYLITHKVVSSSGMHYTGQKEERVRRSASHSLPPRETLEANLTLPQCPESRQ